MSSTSIPAAATHEEIARRAFEIWQENGRRPGMADDNWRAAERELQREREHNVLSVFQDAQDATD